MHFYIIIKRTMLEPYGTDLEVYILLSYYTAWSDRLTMLFSETLVPATHMLVSFKLLEPLGTHSMYVNIHASFLH